MARKGALRGVSIVIHYGVSKPKLPVKFFRTTEGREPVREWLKALAAEERKAIGDDMAEAVKRDLAQGQV